MKIRTIDMKPPDFSLEELQFLLQINGYTFEEVKTPTKIVHIWYRPDGTQFLTAIKELSNVKENSGRVQSRNSARYQS